MRTLLPAVLLHCRSSVRFAKGEVRKIMRQWVMAVALVGGSLAGCGSNDAPVNAGTREAPPPAAAASPNASAAQVAAEARGKLKCPARTTAPARAPGAPVDDVVGVRPGMGYEEARDLVLCSHELLVARDAGRNFQIQTFGQQLRQGFVASFARERVQKSSQDILREMQDSAMARANNRATRDINPGESKWYVATMGLPGQEKVISVAREEWFEAGRLPTSASVEQALVGKYGPPTHRIDREAAPALYLTWAYDLRQRPISETSPLYNRCPGNAAPDAPNNFSPDCGLVVNAAINRARDNQELASHVQVTVVDQAGGYQAITDTEQALQQQEAQRRRDEVERASKNASAPTL